MKKNNFSTQIIGLFMLAFLTLATSCIKDKEDDPILLDPSGENYSLIANVGSQEYTVTTQNIMSGKITIVGQGLETTSFGTAIAIGEYLYQLDNPTKTFVQYKVTKSGMERISSISYTALTTGFWRNVSSPEPGKILLMTWPDNTGKVDYAIISIPSFSVINNGSFTVEKVNGYDAVEIGGPGVVANGQIYLGAMYSNVVDYSTFPDSLLTWKYDYPSFTNPELLVSTASLGATSHYQNHSMIKDENGDIYQQNIRSKHWYNMGTREDKPSVITRIKNGQYDNSYNFNISALFPETISLIGFHYVGNGIAYGRLHLESQASEWNDAAAGNKTAIVKIDLYNKTAVKMNLPLAPYIRAGKWLVANGKLYVPVSPVGQAAFVYEIDPTQGADGFKKGAEIDGNNVVFNALFKH